MLTYAWRMFSDVKHFLRINCQKLFLTAKVLWIVSTYKLIMLIQNMHLYQGVVVRNVPHVSGHSISDTVDHFFQTNHPNHYIDHQAVYNANKYSKLVRKRERVRNWLDYNKLKFERHPDRRPTTKIGFLGICGKRVDSIEYYEQQIKEIDKRIALERQRILKDPKSIMPVAFVSFNSRWGAAHPETYSVTNVFALVFFYMIPIAFVQSLANLEGLERVAPFLRAVIELSLLLMGKDLRMFYIMLLVLMVISFYHVV
ncbi:CSC1-like protein [Vitis vinifera]|uniref:CSC1-like protein n=1 Tax=Vitis vinifera TaxID=29760 RepID=A0A438DGU1_VITVI|nr:CSC1-like protein [Vitis vinifera]